MAVPFGFSIGDFIATIGLASEVINALRETSEAVPEFEGLLDQFNSFSFIFSRLQTLELSRGPSSETVALHRLVYRGQQILETFWRKTRKYQPSLRIAGSGSKLKDGWMRVRWTVAMKKGVAKFQANLNMYMQSIELVLMTIQMC